MNRKVFSLIVIILVLTPFCLCLLSGCVRADEDQALLDTVPDEPDEAVWREDSIQAESVDSPPMILSFDNIEQYRELLNAESMSENQFDEFIRGTDYYWNGIVTKEDLRNFRNLTNDILLPESKQLNLSEITMYPESGLCFLRYSNNINYVCDFSYYLATNQNVVDYYESLERSETAIEIEVGESSCITKMYYITDHEYKDKYSVYYMTINGHIVVCRVHGYTNYEDSYALLSSFKISDNINK